MTTFGKICAAILFCLLVLSAAWIWQYNKIQARKPAALEVATTTVPVYVPTATTTEVTLYETAFAHKTDMFKSVSVTGGMKLAPKTKVSGEVCGSWYFEASFPVELRTGTSTVIWTGLATTGSDWMTTNYVPFTTVLNYTPLGTSTPAVLVLKKDNPSGESINDDELQIAVVLQ
jgi:HAMP domain-containing protein